MTLALPGDIEPFLEGKAFERIRGPAVYQLSVERPDDVIAAWYGEYDHPPAYLDELATAEHVYYVGAANDLLRRLNDHNDGVVRKSALFKVCDVGSLLDVWWFDDSETAFERESMIATELANENPDAYIHQR